MTHIPRTAVRKSRLAMVGSAMVFAGGVVAVALVAGVSGVFMLNAKLMVVAMWPGILLTRSQGYQFGVALCCWGVMGFVVAFLYQLARGRRT